MDGEDKSLILIIHKSPLVTPTSQMKKLRLREAK